MLSGHLVHALGVNPGAVPVQVVDLQLDELHLRVLGEDLVQQLRVVVVGEARVLYQALGLFLQQPVKAVELLELVVDVPLDAVEQVVVEIPGAGLFQLGVEDLVPVLQGVEEPGVELGGQGKALPGVAVHQGRFGGAFAGKGVVHPGGVKIGEALLQEQVHHLFQLFQVHFAGVVLVQGGQPHQAKAQFFHGRVILSVSFCLYCTN